MTKHHPSEQYQEELRSETKQRKGQKDKKSISKLPGIWYGMVLYKIRANKDRELRALEGYGGVSMLCKTEKDHERKTERQKTGVEQLNASSHA
jgi:hypothetical protein